MKKGKRGKRKKEKIEKAERRGVNFRGLIFGIIFLVISFYLIKYALTFHCETKNVEPLDVGQEMIGPLLEQLEPLQRIDCVLTNFKVFFSLLVGVAIIFPAVRAVVRSLTE